MAIVFNDNIVIHAGKPIDAKFGPYNSIAEANASIPLSRRYNGLLFGVYNNPSNIINTDITFYYYYGSFTDTDIRQLLAFGDLNYVQIFNDPESIWNINHNLGKRPSIHVYDFDNNELFGDVNFVNLNEMIITFSEPVNGIVTLN